MGINPRKFDAASRYKGIVFRGISAQVITVDPIDTTHITLRYGRGHENTLRWYPEGTDLIVEERAPSDVAVKFVMIIPRRLNVEIDQCSGMINLVNQLDATLAFNISGDTIVKAKTVTRLSGIAANFSRVEVTETIENVNVEATGAAEITIEGGSTQQLSAAALEGGTIHHHGTVGSAELHAESLGLVTIASVAGKLDQTTKEHGRVLTNE